MIIQYYTDGYKLFARVHLSDSVIHTCMGWLDDGSAEKGIICLHELIIDGLIK